MKGIAKKTVLLASVTLVIVSNAFAADWRHLGSDGKGNHYFYKPKTYSMFNAKIASSWTKIEFNVDEAQLKLKKVAPDDYKGATSTVVFEQFNCAEKKKMVVIGKHYEGRDDNDVPKTGWIAVQPGSIDEGLLTALCKEGGNKKDVTKAPEKK
jgi:hypothetical protein